MPEPSPAPLQFRIDAMRPEDWPEVRHIFAEGIATGQATFETEAPSWERWDGAHRSDLRVVARAEEGVLGWAALSPVSQRDAYSGVAEVSVYVAVSARGLGVGRALLDDLIRRSEEAGMWTLQAGIFPENDPSLALHRGRGFRIVGVRKRIGKLGGVWRNVILLERRSDRVGDP